ncbi:class I glutamine amidotransferase-like protein [Trichoderma austrokoningii]
MAAKKVLVVLTSHDKIDALDKQTGWYLTEFAHPYHFLAEKNVEVTVVSPKGGVAPLDNGSLSGAKNDAIAMAFYDNQKALWENTATIKEYRGRSAEFDAIFFPGGHGPLYDLVDDADSIALVEEFYRAGKVVSAICHGTIALVNVKVDGEYIIKGREIAGFTNEEEDFIKLTSAMPMLVEDKVIAAGGKFVKTSVFGDKIAVDGQFVTGQNPVSASSLGKALVAAIGA